MRAVSMPVLANVDRRSSVLDVEDWKSSISETLLQLRASDMLSEQELARKEKALMDGYQLLVSPIRKGSGNAKGAFKASKAVAYDKNNEHGDVIFMHDSGSNTSLTNSSSTYIPDTMRACDVSVHGIDGSGKVHPIHASVCGDVLYRLQNDVSVKLGGVLLVKDAAIGPAGMDQAQASVLVSTSLLVSDCDVGVHFVEGGESVELLREGSVIHTFHTTPHDDGLYIDRVDLVHKTSKTARIESNFETRLGGNSIDPNLETNREEKYEPNTDYLDDNNLETIRGEKNEPNSEYLDDLEKATESFEHSCRGKRLEGGGVGNIPPSRRKRDGARASKKKLGNIPKKIKERRRLQKLLHGRMHFGKTQHIIDALRLAYDDRELFSVDDWDDMPCDACAFAKARRQPVEKTSSRKAKRVGERFHYDVFTAPWRSDTGCKYLLLVIDEYSGYVWAFGLRKKSFVMKTLKDLIVRIERLLSHRVTHVYRDSSVGVLDDRVASVRCDNAGENVLSEMREWCKKRGTYLETTIAHTPHQNGRAERAGGVVWKGAAALRYAANLPDKYWLYCVLAFVHMSNRLPSSSTRLGKRTPYEDLHDIDITPQKLIRHFRTIGSLCYVVRPPNETHSGKPRLAYKAMMLGYADHEGKKGYMVQRVDDGKLMLVPNERMYKCYENIMIYPAPDTQEEFIRREIRKRKKETIENKYDSDSDSDSNNDSDYSYDNDSDTDYEEEVVETGGSISGDVGGELGEIEAQLGLHQPVMHPPHTRTYTRMHDTHSTPAHTDPDTHEHKHDHEHEHDMYSTPRASRLPAAVRARSPSPVEQGEASAPEIDSVQVEASSPTRCDDNDESEYVIDDVGEDEYEVVGIESFRRTGPKRGGIEYLTEWIGGPPTWEPASTFRLDEKDEETGSNFLPVYDSYRDSMKRGEATEFVAPSESYFNSGESNLRDQIDELKDDSEIDNSIHTSDHRAIVSRAVRTCLAVKGGVAVPSTRKQAQKLSQWKDFEAAEIKELDAFEKHKVWKLVPPSPDIENVIGTRWVYDVKVDKKDRIMKYKARLVAQGYSQVEGIDYNDTFAPTMHIKTLRVLLALAARHKYNVQQYDVSTAFLHATLSETAYVRQPPGHEVEGKEDWVYKLDKAMYGLKNAPKAYSDHFMAELRKLDFSQSYKDECLWTLQRGKSFVHALFHVDDIIMVSNDDELRLEVEAKLKTSLDLKCEGEPEMFLGVAIARQADGSYRLSQTHYIEKMAERFSVADSKKKVEQPCVYGEKLTKEQLPKTEEEKREAAKLPFQALVGSLIYVSKTRPDVAYAISNVARFMSCWGVVHFKAALRILMYLYYTRDLHHVVAPHNDMTLRAYVDANWKDERESTNANEDVKWKSQYGYLLYIDNVLVSWVSKRASSRAHSSMEAEYYAADECAKEVVWFRALLDELTHTQSTPTLLYEDNDACISFSKNNTCHARTKHIDLRAYCLRDYVFDGVCTLKHVSTQHQLADGLTKAQLKGTFVSHVSKMFSGADIIPPESSLRQSKKKSKPWFKGKRKKALVARASADATADLERVRRERARVARTRAGPSAGDGAEARARAGARAGPGAGEGAGARAATAEQKRKKKVRWGEAHVRVYAAEPAMTRRERRELKHRARSATGGKSR